MLALEVGVAGLEIAEAGQDGRGLLEAVLFDNFRLNLFSVQGNNARLSHNWRSAS